jgi:Ca-activated chloride channel family protein
MSFLWPSFLLLLSLIPVLIAVYIWVLKRRKRLTVRYSSLWLIRAARPNRPHWRRHLPFAFFLLALGSLIMALGRPVASISVPSSRATIMLALDVSLSMCASDILPNRLTVAQEAAETFILNQEPGTQIGIVAFAGFAELIVPPNADREVLLNAVRNLTAARRTAIGSAILRSLDAIAEVNDAVTPVNVYLGSETSEPTPLPAIPLQPDIIVLLTDGASNRGAPPLVAAQAAADRGIRVYTIGYGTPEGLPFNCTARQLGGANLWFGGGFGSGNFGSGGGRFQIALDEETLQQVAVVTNAEYYQAESADELLDVFANVPTYIETTKVTTEISFIFVAVAFFLSLLAVVLALHWNPLP